MEGMEIVDQFAMVGDPSMGLDQGRLWSSGGKYIESLRMKPTMIKRLYIGKDEAEE